MPSKIDESICLKCGLCIKNCPHEAIEGTNPSKVSTSDVYERVWIDPDLCQDCGTCTSMDYWCPAEAISEEGAAPKSKSAKARRSTPSTSTTTTGATGSTSPKASRSR